MHLDNFLLYQSIRGEHPLLYALIKNNVSDLIFNKYQALGWALYLMLQGMERTQRDFFRGWGVRQISASPANPSQLSG
jgi:hypothetical protein